MDAAEAEVMKGLFRGRSAELENTVFALMAPDGKTKLCRSGRSPGTTFRSSEAFVEAMAEITEDHAAGVKRKASRTKELPPLPTYKSFRIALNVASADSRPLMVALVEEEEDREEAVERLRGMAWSEEFIGRFHYAAVLDRSELEMVEGLPKGDALLLIEPDTYGLEGEVLADLDLDARAKALQAFFAEGIEAYEPVTKDPRAHVRNGRRSGKSWESELEVTDGRQARDKQ